MLPTKKTVTEALLQGPSVFVHLDPRREGVVVPKWFLSQPQLVLQIGLSMAVPIVDLAVGDEGIGCTLSFNRAPSWCYLPWSAVYAVVSEDGRGMVWPEDVPAELGRPGVAPARLEPRPGPPAGSPGSRAKKTPPGSDRPRPPYLRLVK